MEFSGRIMRVLPKQSGVSQKTGNQWERLPFVFEYFERADDRWPDRVVLDTYDTNYIPHIKEGLEVRIGFGHSVREYEGKVFNELRMYKIESIRKGQQQTAANAAGTVAQPQQVAPFAPQQQQAAAPFPPQQAPQENDDLPF